MVGNVVGTVLSDLPNLGDWPMDLVLAFAFSVFGAGVLGNMARTAWSWVEPPEHSVFVKGAYAASAPSCLMAAVFAGTLLLAAIAGRDTHARWLQAVAVLFLVLVLALGAIMYMAFTYRRPRALVPPALRLPEPESKRT